MFLVFFVLWACFLVLVFYEEHIAMQHTLMASRIDHADSLAREDADADEHAIEGPLADPDAASPSEDPQPPLGGEESSDALTAGHSGNGNAPQKQSSKLSKDVSPMLLETGLPEDAAKEGKSSGPSVPADESIELWPVLRPEDAAYTASRPRGAGAYTVLILDEPPRKFKLGKARRVFKYTGGAVLMRKDSLEDVQERTDRESNWYWMQNGRSSIRRDTAGAEVEDDFEDLQDAGEDPSQEESSSKKGAQEGGGGKGGGGIYAMFKNALAALVPRRTRATAQQIVEARMRVVERTFKRLFGDDFVEVVPIYRTKARVLKVQQGRSASPGRHHSNTSEFLA